jgi:hypothetical protein
MSLAFEASMLPIILNSSRAPCELRSVPCFLALLILVSTGCSKSPTLETTAFIEDGISAANKKEDDVSKAAREFFSEWLANHGETNIVNDATGVGIANSPTRLWAFRYGNKESSTTELEFRIVLPDGREIVEFVAGMGSTENGKDQSAMAMMNFCMSTFHVVYSCFMNHDDPHMSHEEVTIGSQEFLLTSGGMIAFGSDLELPNFSEVSKRIKDSLLASGLVLSPQAHWLKVVYGQHQSKSIIVSVTLDNVEKSTLTERISHLNWPQTDGFYLAKEFIVLRPKKSATQER